MKKLSTTAEDDRMTISNNWSKPIFCDLDKEKKILDILNDFIRAFAIKFPILGLL